MVKLSGFPSASVPLEVFVIVLPYLYDDQIAGRVNIPTSLDGLNGQCVASTCFIIKVSNWTPVPPTCTGLPSYFAVYELSAAVPSAR